MLYRLNSRRKRWVWGNEGTTPTVLQTLVLLKVISLTVSGDILCSVKTWGNMVAFLSEGCLSSREDSSSVFLHQRCLWASLPLSPLGSVPSRSIFIVFCFTNYYLYGLEKLFLGPLIFCLNTSYYNNNNNDNSNSSLLIKCFRSILNLFTVLKWTTQYCLVRNHDREDKFFS